MALSQRPSIVAIGDSLTEYGFKSDNTTSTPSTDGWLSLLAQMFVGRADVLNRGTSGYTSNQALQMVRYCVPKTRLALVMIGFGTNDAAAPGSLQHVHVDVYERNLRDVGHALLSDPTYGRPVVLFISPSKPTPRWIKDVRDPEVYAQYTNRCARVAAELSCGFVNMFDALCDFHLSDGLHLNAKGNQLLFELVVQQINTCAPSVAALPVVTEYWQMLLTRTQLPPLLLSRDTYYIYRLPSDVATDTLPSDALRGSFSSITRTRDELSIVTTCSSLSIEGQQRASTVWRAVHFGVQLDFSLIGVLSGVLNVLKSANVSVFCIATYDTDWILFDVNKTEIVTEALVASQYQVKDE
jgi:lysophospholipase L1-like esterase